MIDLPDFSKVWDYENNFILSCDSTRIGQILAHYELYKMVLEVPGVYVECGVFKGVSFCRFAMLRDLFGNAYTKKMIGFDTYGEFPPLKHKLDESENMKKFLIEAGTRSISKEQLMTVLQHKRVDQNIELIEGDILETVPEYVRKHPELKISLLNLDVDLYEPSAVILKYLYPRLEKDGILILDDYGFCAGETKAVDEYFEGEVKIRKFPFCLRNPYIIKQ